VDLKMAWTKRKKQKYLPLLGTELGFSGYAAHSLVTTLSGLSVFCSPLINLKMKELISPHNLITYI
jgi:hypothetical protein